MRGEKRMDNQFPKIIKGLREQKKISQKDMAEHLNISQRAYSHYETGESEPKMEALIRLANFFNLPIDVLVGRYTLPDLPEPKERKTRKRNPPNKYETECTKEITP